MLVQKLFPERTRQLTSDSDPEYELSVVSESDLQLDSNMDNTVLGSDDECQASDYQMQLLQSHQEAFHKAFSPL
jgi:hypothetical protein